MNVIMSVTVNEGNESLTIDVARTTIGNLSGGSEMTYEKLREVPGLLAYDFHPRPDRRVIISFTDQISQISSVARKLIEGIFPRKGWLYELFFPRPEPHSSSLSNLIPRDTELIVCCLRA